MGRACSLVTAVRFLNAKNGVDYKFSLHFLPGLWYTCLRNKCHAISTICLQLRESVGCRYRRCVLCSYLEEALTHTVTHTTKRVDGSNGTDGADVRNTPDRKAPKALKTARRSTPIHFVISRSCVRVTPPAPKSIENFGFRCFFVAKTLKWCGSKCGSSALTHTVKCTERVKEHRRGNRFLSGALLACGTYRICAMKLPIFSAAFCCICRVAWV